MTCCFKLGMDPPRFLAVADVVELAIDGLGAQRQQIAPPRVAGAGSPS